jgi:hypothetical protein
MKVNKFNKFLLLTTILILFSGCFSIGINQELKEDGSSDFLIKYDFSSLISQMEDLDQGEENEIPDCSLFENLTTIDCQTVKEGIFELSGSLEKNDKYFRVEKSLFKTSYEYDALEVFDILGQLSEKEEEQITQDSLLDFKMLNPTLKYEVTMPGEIVSAEVGEFKGNKVKIDIFDLETESSAKIVSKTNSNTIYYIIGISVVILTSIIVVVVMKKNKTDIKAPNETGNVSEEEIKIRDYIFKFKNQYSKDSIKASVVSTGITESKAIEYLNKYY